MEILKGNTVKENRHEKVILNNLIKYLTRYIIQTKLLQFLKIYIHTFYYELTPFNFST